ncbi:MAG: hypothetical protein PHQ90_06590, partial [Sulfuricurvum sp.]|nr:hypothetical protein [Sulfuricurvum sp.]
LRNYSFHSALHKKLLTRYPHLNNDQVSLVLETLRDYFAICNQSGKRMVSMPSQVVDVAWHEFILFTRAYKEFCSHALGRFLHHTPTEAMKTPTLAQDGIKHTWMIACSREKIDPAKPDRLPMIFAIDGLLNIEDGYHYVLDCANPASPMYGSGYCASDIGCSSGCSADTGGDSGSDGSGCGGGCGGD